MTTVYISGPMTGHPDYNRPAFHAMANKLRAGGYEVLNPAEVDLGERATWEDYLRKDLQMLVTVQEVCMLPGWQSSQGALLEVAIARILGIPVVDYPGTGPHLIQSVTVQVNETERVIRKTWV